MLLVETQSKDKNSDHQVKMGKPPGYRIQVIMPRIGMARKLYRIHRGAITGWCFKKLNY